MRCGYRVGNYECRTEMRERIGRYGRLTWECPTCTHREAGRCVRCPRRRGSRRVYCDACHVEVKRETGRRYWQRGGPELRVRHRLEGERSRRKRRGGRDPLTRHEIGQIAGKARAAALTPQRRAEIARLAGLAEGRRRRAIVQARASS